MNARDWLRDRLLWGHDDDICAHELKDIWPSEDEAIWYLTAREQGDESWTEYDAAYIRVRGITKHFTCLGCGEERTIQTSERVGGDDALMLKSEAPAGFHEEHGPMSGAFFNGFPD